MRKFTIIGCLLAVGLYAAFRVTAGPPVAEAATASPADSTPGQWPAFYP